MGLDEESLWWLNVAAANPVFDAAAVLLAVLGTAYVFALGALYLWARGRRSQAIDFLVVVALSSLLVLVVKWIVLRPRPFEVLDWVRVVSVALPWSDATDPSFPSAHAARAFAAAALLLPRWNRSAAVVWSGVLAIALSRCYAGVHYPSDVLAGALLGGAVALFVTWLRRRNPYRRAVQRAIELATRRPVPAWQS